MHPPKGKISESFLYFIFHIWHLAVTSVTASDTSFSTPCHDSVHQSFFLIDELLSLGFSARLLTFIQHIHNWGRILKARDAAKHLTAPRTVTHNKELCGLKYQQCQLWESAWFLPVYVLESTHFKNVNPFPYSPPGYFKELARSYLIFFSIQVFSSSGSKIPHKPWF